MPDEFWIVVTQYDQDPNGVFMGPPNMCGPLVHESFLLTYEQAWDRAKALAGRYGWASVFKVNIKEQL